jgi:hypothetical protein
MANALEAADMERPTNAYSVEGDATTETEHVGLGLSHIAQPGAVGHKFRGLCTKRHRSGRYSDRLDDRPSAQ